MDIEYFFTSYVYLLAEKNVTWLSGL